MTDSRPAVFLDRDGTLIEDADYLADPAGVSLIPGTTDALLRLRAAGYALVVVTNQSGIDRGLYSVEAYHAVAAKLDGMLSALGVPVDATYFCPHHPEFSGPCGCRKPGVGMYQDAVRDLRLDAASSWYVGDKVTDVLPADIMGGRGILVRTGYGLEHEARVPEGTVIVDDLSAGAAVIAP